MPLELGCWAVSTLRRVRAAAVGPTNGSGTISGKVIAADFSGMALEMLETAS